MQYNVCRCGSSFARPLRTVRAWSSWRGAGRPQTTSAFSASSEGLCDSELCTCVHTTVLIILYIVQYCIVQYYIVQFCIVQCTCVHTTELFVMYIVQYCIVHLVCCTVYGTVLCSVQCMVQCIVQRSSQSTVFYSCQCICTGYSVLYSIQCIVKCTVYCTMYLYSVQCTTKCTGARPMFCGGACARPAHNWTREWSRPRPTSQVQQTVYPVFWGIFFLHEQWLLICKPVNISKTFDSTRKFLKRCP